MELPDFDPTAEPDTAATEASLAAAVDGASRDAADLASSSPGDESAPPEAAPRRKPKKAPVARTSARATTRNKASGDGAPTLDRLLPLAVNVRPVPEGAALDDPSLYFNRELSWLDFNWRVLYQALDTRTPLLERVHFVAITANNLDEFYRKRIGGLKRQLAAGVRALSPDGRTPREQLDLSLAAALDMQHRLDQLWTEALRPRLAEAGFVVRTVESLDADERARVDAVFRDAIFPILTPLALDPGHPFPFISNGSLSLAFVLRHPTRGTEHFARLKIPTGRGRWVPVDDGQMHVVALEDVIRHNAGDLFRGMEVEAAHAFRVTRNASLERSEDEADDLLELIAEELRERRFADVVRLEVEADMPERVRHLLAREMGLDEVEDVVNVQGLLDLSGLFSLPRVDLPHLRYLPHTAVVPVRLRHRELEEEPDIFAAIRQGDILVHHPYESFASSTQRFIEDAADDPHVLAIKQTLYRTSDDSPVVRALIRAAERGKQVAVLIELKARFDEENNISWARRLEEAGAHVAYGLVGLKTHAKTTLVVREEKGRLRCYAHVGTGNYNPSTARFYTDFGLLTCREDIGQDLVHLFHSLTGYAPEQEYQTIAVAPRDLRARFVELIRREVRHQRKSGTGRIVAKMNALDDMGIIRELYRASGEGVQIDLIIRGHCRLRPGVPGVSETIRVSSIIGRFLEHSRIYYFHNDGEGETYIGSADWMRRNLDDRVEVVLPVRDAKAEKRLLRTLRFALDDNVQAWDLQPDGRYLLRYPAEGEPVQAFHETLMQRARRRTEKDDANWTF
ncbi:MAG TPA: polyphosphate kinase 1 [Rubricoccaceae bacterium]|jgi:polyphosphate kinase